METRAPTIPQRRGVVNPGGRSLRPAGTTALHGDAAPSHPRLAAADPLAALCAPSPALWPSRSEGIGPAAPLVRARAVQLPIVNCVPFDVIRLAGVASENASDWHVSDSPTRPAVLGIGSGTLPVEPVTTNVPDVRLPLV